VVEFLANPAESLLEIRRKGQAGQLLSRAQWTALAYFVQQGSEAFAKNPLSRESYIGILKAFDAMHELRAKPSARDEYYLGNLPSSRMSMTAWDGLPRWLPARTAVIW
jgi:hypothetical protein